MSVAINIAIITLGFLGALTAFGGEAWKKGNESLRRRVTRRGWLSLLCLCLSLALGITKEVRDSGEKSDLEDQVAQLNGQLKQQRVLLAAKRLEDIRDQDRVLEDMVRRISLVQDVYGRFRAATVTVQGRTLDENPPQPFRSKFTYSSTDFLMDVCAEPFKVRTGLKFVTEDCKNALLLTTIRLLPTQAYERSPFGPSVITLMQFISEISVAHGQALNGPPTRNGSSVLLADLFADTHKLCGVAPDIAAAQEDRAKAIRAIERAAQQLNWLFLFGYSEPEAKYKKWLEGRFSSASAELLLQIPRLSELVNTSRSPEGVQALKLGPFIESIAAGYQQLSRDIAQTKGACQARREQLRAERRGIEDWPAGAASK